MIKAALVGVVAIAGVIAGEIGADKVLAMRQARATAPMTFSEAWAPSASPFSKSPSLTAI